MNKIALLSDIHGNILALEAVAADLADRGIDTVVTLGDLVSGPLWPVETVRFLMKQNWVQIAGNHERQLLTLPPSSQGPSDRNADSQLNEKEHEWLRHLPATLRLTEEIFLCHATPGNDKVYLLETIGDDSRIHLASPDKIRERLDGSHFPVIACGHSHTPRAVQLTEGILIVNPGSVGMPAYTDDSTTPSHVVETGSPHARYAILEKTAGGWTPQLIAVAYDFETAARMADRMNRPELAMGLRTGYVTL